MAGAARAPPPRHHPCRLPYFWSVLGLLALVAVLCAVHDDAPATPATAARKHTQGEVGARTRQGGAGEADAAARRRREAAAALGRLRAKAEESKAVQWLPTAQPSACSASAQQRRLPTVWPMPRALRRGGVNELPLRAHSTADEQSAGATDERAPTCVPVAKVEVRYVPPSLVLNLDGNTIPRLMNSDASALVLGAAGPACGDGGTLEVIVRRASVVITNGTRQRPDGAYELNVREVELDSDAVGASADAVVARAEVTVEGHRGLVYALQTLAQLVEPGEPHGDNATAKSHSHHSHHRHDHHHPSASDESPCTPPVLRALPLTVSDAPVWRHRGISVLGACGGSAGAIARLNSIVKFASAAKLNVVHLHLTDEYTFGIPVDSGSNAGQLPRNAAGCSLDALKSLAAEAARLGVSLVPGIEVPGRAASWGKRLASRCQREPSTVDPLGSPLRLESGAAHAAVREALRLLMRAFPRAPWIHVGGEPGGAKCWAQGARLGSVDTLPRARRSAADHAVPLLAYRALATLEAQGSESDPGTLAARAGMPLGLFVDLAERSTTHAAMRERAKRQADTLYQASLYHFYRLLYTSTLPSLGLKPSQVHHWDAVLAPAHTGGYALPRSASGPVMHIARPLGTAAEGAALRHRLLASAGWHLDAPSGPLGCATWFECYQNSLRHGRGGHAVLPHSASVLSQTLGGAVRIVENPGLGDDVSYEPAVLTKALAASERMWRDPPLPDCDADSVRDRLDAMAGRLRALHGLAVAPALSLDKPLDVGLLEQPPCRMGSAWWAARGHEGAVAESAPEPPDGASAEAAAGPAASTPLASRLWAFACLMLVASGILGVLTLGCRVRASSPPLPSPSPSAASSAASSSAGRRA